MFFLYRFIDKEGKIIYIGRTNDIERRILKEHFTDNTHLPKECYLEIEKVEYTKVINESEEVAYEAILINEIKPKYNIQFKDKGKFQIKLPKFEWTEFQWEYEEQLEWLKRQKENTINEYDILLNYFANSKIQDIRTGIIDVDSGMLISQQSFTLIAGVTGSSKTSYALNIANYNVNKGKRVLFINLKESVENLSIRALSINTMIPIDKLLLKKIDEQECNECLESMIASNKNSISFYNSSVDYLKLDKILLTIRESNADLVIIDDLQMIELDREEAERNKYVRDKMNYILKMIKALSLQTMTPIIGTYCIPIGKTSSRADHRPILADLEFDSLQWYPDNIQLLYRDELYNPNDSEYKNMVEIITVKNVLNQYYTTKVIYSDRIGSLADSLKE